jgi:hypothetical protein
LKTNAPEKEDLTPGETQAEDTPDQSDSQKEGEPQLTEGEAPEVKTEPPAGSKSWEHALQQSREREKREVRQRMELEQQLKERENKIQEYEMEGLSESERYRVEAETAQSKVTELEEKLETEEIKKEYRKFLAEKSKDRPKTVAFLRKQADKDIYPVQGQTPEEVEESFNSFAEDYEGVVPTEDAKTPSSSPAYTPPAEVDINKLPTKELKKILPVADKD